MGCLARVQGWFVAWPGKDDARGKEGGKVPAGECFIRLASLRRRTAVGRKLGQVGGAGDRGGGRPPGLADSIYEQAGLGA